MAGEIDTAAFDALAVSLKEKIAGLAAIEIQFKKRSAALNEQDEANASFIAAVVKQGRGQFPEGSQERRLIEAIAAPSHTATDTTDETVPSNEAGAAAGSTTALTERLSPSVASVPAPMPVDFVTLPPLAVNQ